MATKFTNGDISTITPHSRGGPIHAPIGNHSLYNFIWGVGGAANALDLRQEKFSVCLEGVTQVVETGAIQP